MAPGAAAAVTLDVSAVGLTTGTYPLSLVLTTTDPAAPTTAVPLTLTVGATATDDGSDTRLALDAPAPNPARGSTALAYTLDEAGPVRLAVLDLLGREVAVVVDGEASAGRHTAAPDTARLAPGVYVARLSAGARTATRRLVVVR